ncbi:MAG TPA: hypothetical protein VM658_05155 [bacterium]|nr:hypothetical protein [bacterium]
MKLRSIGIAVLAYALAAASALLAASNPQDREGLFAETAVIIVGAQAPALNGADISALSLAASHDGRLTAIPMQVDEVRDGEHVFAWVSPKGREKGLHDRDVDNGRLDADDEIVFMARDLGPRAEPVQETGAAKAVELSVTDPASGRTAYAYLLLNSKLPRCQHDYVKMDISGERLHIETERYQFSQQADLGYFDELRVRTANGNFTPDLVVRNQTPGVLKVKVIGLTGEVDFYDLIRGETIATKDGPVRALWRAAGGADFGVFRIKGQGGTEQHYYFNRMDQPVMMDIPFDFNSVLSSFVIRGTVVLDPKVLPLTYYDVSHRQGVILDGVPDSPDGPLIGRDARDWCVGSGRGMSVYYIVHFPDEWKKTLKQVSFVDDGPGRSEGGSQFGDMVDLLTRGLHQYMVRFYIVPHEFKWGDEKNIEDMAGDKLQVSCAEVP